MTNPNSLFRWEDSAGLEHACWACPTKANSPRALHSCYGIHSMPCASYHPTMHAIGGAHRCSACAMAREMHDHRHREIAELVAEYNLVDGCSLETPTRSTALLERPVNLANRRGQRKLTTILNRDQSDEDDDEAPDSENEENSADEDDTISLVSSGLSTCTGTDTPTRKLTKAEQRAQKKAKKSQRSQDKAMKNQGRQLATVTSTDIDTVARIMHGDAEDVQTCAHPLATDKTIEDVIARNLGFVKHIQTHKQYLYKSIVAGRKESKERKRLKRREQKGEYEDIETEEVVNAILFKLEVNFSSSTGQSTDCTSSMLEPRNRRKRAASSVAMATTTMTPKSSTTPAGFKSKTQILQKLRDAIKDDLEKHENDVRGTYVRAGGFWRYVGKAVFERMTEIARDMDVSTGENWEKKMKREANVKEKSQNQSCEDE